MGNTHLGCLYYVSKLAILALFQLLLDGEEGRGSKGRTMRRRNEDASKRLKRVRYSHGKEDSFAVPSSRRAVGILLHLTDRL